MHLLQVPKLPSRQLAVLVGTGHAQNSQPGLIRKFSCTITAPSRFQFSVQIKMSWSRTAACFLEILFFFFFFWRRFNCYLRYGSLVVRFFLLLSVGVLHALAFLHSVLPLLGLLGAVLLHGFAYKFCLFKFRLDSKLV